MALYLKLIGYRISSLKFALLIIATCLFLSLPVFNSSERLFGAENESVSNLNLPGDSLAKERILPDQTSHHAPPNIMNRGLAATKRITGDIGESLMDKVLTLEGWEKIPSKRGVHGIDGLYVKRRNGQIRQVMVVESKYGTGSLTDTLHGKQLSHEWITKNVSDLISDEIKEINQCRIRSCSELPKLQNELRELKSIKKITSDPNAYRRRLINSDIVDGKLIIKSSYVDKNGNIVTSPHLSSVLEPLTISLKNPPVAGKKLLFYNAKFETLKEVLIKNGVDKTAAANAVEQLKKHYRTGEIWSRQQENGYILKTIIESYDSKIASASNAISRNYYRCLKLSFLMNNKLPDSLRAPVNAAIVAGLFSAAVNGYKVFQGELPGLEAVEAIAKDASLAGVSMYVSEGVIQIIGEKIAITTLQAGPGIGIATFIFDTTQNVYFLAQGSMTEETFYRETAKSLLKSIGSGTAAYCAIVLLHANPASLAVMAVSIGGYLIVSEGIEYFERLDAKNYLFIEDVLGHLPLEMQKRITAFDRGNRTTPWDSPDKITPWERPNNATPWESSNRNTPWD